MKKKDVISSIFLLALAGVVFFEVRKLPIGSLGAPRLGLWPLILAILLVGLSLILLAQAIKKKENKKEKSAFWGGPDSWKRFGLAVGALFAFGFVYEHLGYLISVFLLISFLLRAIESIKWWVVITVALSSSVCSYLLFGVVLETQLPAGLFGF